MQENYRNAFTEVYEIINYLEEEEYNKIPEKVRKIIEENRNKDYEYYINENIPFEEQKMLPETKAILFNFFRDYLCTEKQREKIKKVQQIERFKIEEEKRKKAKYMDEVFKNKKY